MTLRVVYQAGTVANTIRVIYRCDEFSLDYRHQQSQGPPSPDLATAIDERLGIRHEASFFAIADTLEVVFAGEERELVGVEAYTNWQKWLRSSGLALPSLSGLGRIRLIDAFPDDRIDLGVVPEYTYSKDQRLLWVSLAAEYENARYYRLSDSLVAGVDRGELVAILIQNLSIDQEE